MPNHRHTGAKQGNPIRWHAVQCPKVLVCCNCVLSAYKAAAPVIQGPPVSVTVTGSAGIAGVYDIETHYQYEYGRGVAELSTMKRAMGGRRKFATQSPALILNSACGGKARVKLPGVADSPVDSRYGFCHYACGLLIAVTSGVAPHISIEVSYTCSNIMV